MARHSDDLGAGRSRSVSDLARLVGGSLEGDGRGMVRGVARLDEATGDDVAFCALREYRRDVATTAAAAVIVDREFRRPRATSPEVALIRVENTYLAVAQVVEHFFPSTVAAPAVHPTAVIAEDVVLGARVSIGARAVIEAGCEIGDDTSIGAGCSVAAGVRIGGACHLFPNVTVYPKVRIGDRVIIHAGTVIGADGFGYATAEGKHVKIPQVGGVVVEDDVEIGANACIDRAALGVTRIGRGAKIDNLVQIGHNCDIGAHSILCGQVGVSGSTSVGRGVLVGGQAGLAGHIRVGDGAMIAGGSGVTSSVPEAAKVGGYPHIEASRWRRVVAALRTLPELGRRVRRLEAKIVEAEKENT